MAVRIKKIDPEPEPELEPLSPRRRLMFLLEELTEKHPELGPPDIADLVAQTLPDDDRQLVEDFLRTEARTILAYEVRMKFAQNRRGIFATLDLENPEAPQTSQLSEKRQDTLYDRVEAWREYVPSTRRTMPIFDMTRPALFESADADKAKAIHFGFKSILKQRLGEALSNDTMTVGEVFTAEQIMDLSHKIKVEMTRGAFRLSTNQPFQALQGKNSLPRSRNGRGAKGS